MGRMGRVKSSRLTIRCTYHAKDSGSKFILSLFTMAKNSSALSLGGRSSQMADVTETTDPMCRLLSPSTICFPFLFKNCYRRDIIAAIGRKELKSAPWRLTGIESIRYTLYTTSKIATSNVRRSLSTLRFTGVSLPLDHRWGRTCGDICDGSGPSARGNGQLMQRVRPWHDVK